MKKYTNKVYETKKVLLELSTGESKISDFVYVSFDGYEVTSLGECDLEMLFSEDCDGIVVKRTKNTNKGRLE